MGHNFGQVSLHSPGSNAYSGLRVSEPGDEAEHDADRVAARVMESLGSGTSQKNEPLAPAHRAPSVGLRLSARPTLFRQAASSHGPPASAAVPPPTRQSGVDTSHDRPATGGASGLLVEDDARTTTPGQMHKTQFLDELQAGVCATADAELAAAGRSTKGCPYIEKWIGHYRSKDSRYVERSLHKYAPEAAGIKSARDYIPVVSSRIRRSVSVWAKTGQLTGVPDELASEMPGGGLMGAMGGVASGIAGAVGGAVSGLMSGIGSAVSSLAKGVGKAVSSIGSLFFKAKEGGPASPDADHIHSQLGPGQPLDGGVKIRMESAFGHSFSRVRVHNDSTAGQLSTGLNAKAFTLGEHVAFGSGEYRPGTIAGDALIAHELAHVAQQTGDGLPPQPIPTRSKMRGAPGDGNGSDSLENDADHSAVRAVSTLWAPRGAHASDAKAKPKARSGLRLQRCGHQAKAVKGAKEAVKDGTTVATRFRSAKLAAREKSIQEAGDLISATSAWADEAANTQNISRDVTVPRETAVVGLESAQADGLKQATDKLTAAIPLLDATAAGPVKGSLDKAAADAKEAHKYGGAEDPDSALLMKAALARTRGDADDALDALAAASDSVDGTEVAAEIEAAKKASQDAQGGNIDALDTLRDAIENAKKKLYRLRQDAEQRAKSLAKIRFLVAGFLQVNGKGPAPAPKDVAQFKDILSSGVAPDFAAAFGEKGANAFTLFIDYAPRLEQQL
ncbi:MAG: DUF4157 domain-containing protein, partial [Blastocatellia bacterium]